MQKARVGELLKRFRMERQLDVKEVCIGLCSVSAIGYFERGQHVPDILLFERLLERMGVSPEEVSMMVSGGEYEYLMWKEEVFESIEKKHWNTIKELIASDICKKISCNEKIERQFYYYAKGILEVANEDYANAVRFFEKAAKQTIPQLYEILQMNVLLSSLEVHILMLHLYCGIRSNVLKVAEGQQIFYGFEDYLYNSKADIHERAKCYPKLICMGMHLFSDSFREREQMQFCQKAIDMLRGNKSFDDITELLRLYIPMLKKRENRECSFYEKQYEVFCDLLQSEGADTEFRLECFNRSMPKLYLVSEYFKMKRTEKNMTQEQVSEEICAPETYSRIESGVRFPKVKKHEALTERLEIGWCYYRGELDALELSAYELRRQHRIAEIEGRRYDALDLLDDLEAIIDMNNVTNYQYVTLCRCVSECRLRKIETGEACKALEELLYLTHKKEEDVLHLTYYSQTELEIIGHCAQFLREQGKYEEGIALCENVIKQMENSRVDFEQQWNGFSFVFRVLSGLYFSVGRYEESMQVANYVKKIYVKRKEGANLSEILDEIADDYEHIGEQHSLEYKKLYCYTYYVADFFRIEKIVDFAKKYYEEHFEQGKIWYENYIFSTSLL